MKANELRIGNYVLSECLDSKGYFEETRVTGIFWDEIHHDAIGMTKPIWENEIERIKPIPITEEILLKFGFENGIDEMTLTTESFCIYWRKFEGHFEINGEKYFKKYIHELQNLYFALTGKELSYE